METVTRPTLPRRLSSAPTDTIHRLSHAARRVRYTTAVVPERRPWYQCGYRIVG
jgi:hypothetical protein